MSSANAIGPIWNGNTAGSPPWVIDGITPWLTGDQIGAGQPDWTVVTSTTSTSPLVPMTKRELIEELVTRLKGGVDWQDAKDWTEDDLTLLKEAYDLLHAKLRVPGDSKDGITDIPMECCVR